MANKSWEFENQFNTKFDLALVAKLFKAVGIAILVEQGKLELDDKFVKHYTDFPVEAARNIRIKQLLSHTSGISDFR